jgi:hypothetical protein
MNTYSSKRHSLEGLEWHILSRGGDSRIISHHAEYFDRLVNPIFLPSERPGTYLSLFCSGESCLMWSFVLAPGSSSMSISILSSPFDARRKTGKTQNLGINESALCVSSWRDIKKWVYIAVRMLYQCLQLMFTTCFCDIIFSCLPQSKCIRLV